MPRGNIHGVDRSLESALRRLARNPQLTSEAKATLGRFVEDLVSQGLSKYRQLWYLTHLVPFAKGLGKAFLQPTKEDVKRALAKVERSDLSEWSKVNKRVAVKRFYKWLLRDDEDYPDVVKWIRTTLANHKRKLPEDLLTRGEIRRLIDGGRSTRDKALISLLADGGLRIGEALGLRVKDFHPDRYGGYVMVQGKTGARRVRLIDSITHLAAWLKDHPFQEDRDAALFCYLADQKPSARWKGSERQEERLRGHARGRPLGYAAARKAIRQAALRTGVPVSKVHPQNFRHSRATQLARDVPEMPLEAQMGWVPGSKMAQVYVHLSGRDQDAAILKAHGIDLDEEEGRKPGVPRRCPRCGTFNEASRLEKPTRFCQGCGMALTMEALQELDEEMSQSVDLQEIAILLRNPKVKQLLSLLDKSVPLSGA